ncbi:shikimate O-hydroxycinnamoyltransferase-like [Humulus lupulus]|uniref:shikimate O-hydroxycinnamoyltransferase-like n=1 Tax=Humulus lupulus TaxID=3486 RepID=UPI002B4146EA|nr:shikimate O-hydroxycinnamoyltransferase-like [Humulus lupulus]
MAMAMIKEKESSMVKPAEKTPRRRLWLSILDMMINSHTHVPILYFYRSNNGASNFFDANILKQALSKVLVPFYPIAGRLRLDGGGRTEIDCNEEGVLFVTAETTAVIDDLGDFAPSQELRRLTPTVDYSLGISSYPLLLSQVTYFKCGGVSLGIGFNQQLADGPSAFHFIESWSKIARGLDITIPPFLERTLLRPRNPPQPSFHHIEYQPHHQQDFTKVVTKVACFKLTKEQLNTIKAKAKEDVNTNNTTKLSTYETFAAHIWKCVCQAREQSDDQQTTLYFPISGRFSNRLQPPLPPGYFGRGIFAAASMAKVGDLKTKPLSYAASCIHKDLEKMDNDYLRSSIDHLELHPNASSLRHGPHTYSCPNLRIISWVRLVNYDVDFGWSRPIYIGPGGIMYEGKSYVIPCLGNDGSLLVHIALQPQHITAFEILFYQYDENKRLGVGDFIIRSTL